eukprot:5693471-Amphidinium_carterae.1
MLLGKCVHGKVLLHGRGNAGTEIALARVSLRPYQEKANSDWGGRAVRAIQAASPDNCCVVLPCGAGKTRVGPNFSEICLQASPSSCAFPVPAGAAAAAAFLNTESQGACVMILCL